MDVNTCSRESSASLPPRNWQCRSGQLGLITSAFVLVACAAVSPEEGVAQGKPVSARSAAAKAAPSGKGTATPAQPETSSAAPQSGTAPRSAGAHPLATNLAQAGSFACAERANQIGNFLDPAARAEILLPGPQPQPPNQRLLVANLVVPIAEGRYAIGGVAMAPNQANGCAGSYRVMHWEPVSCDRAVGNLYPGARFNVLPTSKVQIAAMNNSLWVLAMPAGPGCLLQKEEIVH